MAPDKLPPHNLESENALLGCVFLDPRLVMPQIEGRIKGREVFYDGRNQAIYATLSELSRDNSPIDLVTVWERLKGKGTFPTETGLQYLSALPDAAPSGHAAPYYLGIVLENFVRRQILAFATEATQKVYEGDKGETLIDEIEKKVSELSKQYSGETETSIDKIVDAAWSDLEAAYNRGNELTGISTGFSDLDKMTNGLKPADMFVVAARPSMGKTSLAMNIAEYVATDLNIPVGVFSLEMTKESLMRRMLCTRARINERDVREQKLSERDFTRLGASRSNLRKANLFIDDTSGLNILQVRARARRMVQQHGIKLLVVDYLQLLQSVTGKIKDNNREREVADISNGIKSILKELSIPGVILAQLNRELEKDKNRKPRLSDLRESGAIEQDADIIGMLYCPEDEPENPEIIPVNMMIAKQRNGPTGDVRFTFFKAFTKFEQAARELPNYDKDGL